MTKNEQIIIDNIDKITVQIHYPHRGSCSFTAYFYCDSVDISQNVARRLYNKNIIDTDKKLSGNFSLKTYTLKIKTL
jgi:hypothetical protein